MIKLSASAKGSLSIGILGAIYLFNGRDLNLGSVTMPGEGFVPRIMGLFLLVCCISLFLKEVFFLPLIGSEPEKNDQNDSRDEEEDTKRPQFLMVALLIYSVALPVLGFILSTIGLMVASLRIFEYRNWRWSFIIAVATTAFTYLVFEKWLQILFPTGLWG